MTEIPNSLKHQNENTVGPTIKKFMEEICSLPQDQKMAQIGISRSVLGIPNENAKFDGKSFFDDNAFVILKEGKTPKIWLDFLALPQLGNIISKMPPETLFFIFYTQPHDEIQILAAKELKERGWALTQKGYTWYLQKRDSYLTFDIENWVIKEVSKF